MCTANSVRELDGKTEGALGLCICSVCSILRYKDYPGLTLIFSYVTCDFYEKQYDAIKYRFYYANMILFYKSGYISI